MKNPFTFEAPPWANRPTIDDKDDALQRARDIAACVYPLGVQSGVHAMSANRVAWREAIDRWFE